MKCLGNLKVFARMAAPVAGGIFIFQTTVKYIVEKIAYCEIIYFTNILKGITLSRKKIHSIFSSIQDTMNIFSMGVNN